MSKMNKALKILLAIMVTGTLLFLTVSCAGGGDETDAPKPQIATVQRGNISIIVVGTGNLALKNKQELTFGETGLVSQASYAKISDVLIAEGAMVEDGQVLVKADTKDWQDQIVSNQYALDSAKYNLAQAQSGVAQAETALFKAQNNVEQAKISVTDAQNKVIAAQSTLDSAKYALSMQQDVKELQDKIDEAEIKLQQAKIMLQTASREKDTAGARYWREMINYYEEDTNPESASSRHVPDGGLIGVYKSQMERLINDPEHADVTSSIADIKARVSAVEQAENNMTVVRQNVVNAQNEVLYAGDAVVKAQSALDLANDAVVIARNKVDEAQKNLDDAQKSNQEIIAPFRGLITKVSVNTGDIVQRSSSLIEIAEPDKFIANVLVTERDIMNVTIGRKASVSCDALSGLSFPAEITQVAPLATIQSGVVNYTVTVELTSLVPESSQAMNGLTAFSGGGPPQGFSPPEGFTPPAGGAPQSGMPSSGAPGTAPEDGISLTPVNLKDGLSATVTIPVQEKNDVIVVASRAIVRRAGISTVQVVTDTGTETRTVKTGLSDSTNTEITEGLKEGEQIMIQIASSSSGMMRGGFPF
ncbi:MAG: HlyD family efflux transporter periplasmic adaptor subunit [Dehalococcoidales bacterium]|nr:HlyD family efflux transporter periplasmic adaptor subunit [Dehalococcoidales bacterium]